MPEPTESQTPEPTTPPWGDDFDPARAWQTITHLRQVEDDQKAQIAALTTECDTARAEAEAATERATTAETERDTLKRTAAVADALRAKGLDPDLAEFITADDADGIVAQAERLAERLGSNTEPKADEKDPQGAEKEPEEPKNGRPAPALTPGHGGTPPAPVDFDAIAASAHRR